MNDTDRLGLFVRRADELRSLRLIRSDQLAARMNLSWDRVKGLRLETNAPDEEDLRSFLLTFRQFVSAKEPVFLNRIFNICHSRLRSDELRGYLVEAREEWKRNQRGNGVVVTIDDRTMTPERVTELLINGHYFHSTDLPLQRELQGLGPPERLLVRWVFLNFVVDATRQVLYVATVVNVALRGGLMKLD